MSTLNPSIVGQAEKAHNAVLDRVLAGTTLDERQWITLQLAAAGGESVARSELIDGIAAKAKFRPAAIEASIAALIDAGLLDAPAEATLQVTAEGRDLIARLRSSITGLIEPAYRSVSDEDLVTAARVLQTITAKLSEEA